MNKYENKTDKFLKDTKTSFKVKFLKNDYHFTDDKETRDIFKVTFKRNNKRFSVNFGQSIYDSDYNGSNIPSSYDVLACLQKYEIGSFQDFISEYGYNQENLDQYPKILKIYKACIKEYNNVLMLWSDVLDQLQGI